MSRYFFCKYSEGECAVALLLDFTEPILWAFLQERGRGLAKRGVRIIPLAEAGFGLKCMKLGVKPEETHLHPELNSLKDDYFSFWAATSRDAEGFIKAYPQVAVPFLRGLADEKRREFDEKCKEAISEYFAKDKSEREHDEELIYYHVHMKGEQLAPDGEVFICPHEATIPTLAPPWVALVKKDGERIVQSILDRMENLIHDGYPKDVPEGFWREFTPTVDDVAATDTPVSAAAKTMPVSENGGKKKRKLHEGLTIDDILPHIALYREGSALWIAAKDVNGWKAETLGKYRQKCDVIPRDGIGYGVDKDGRVFCKAGNPFYYLDETTDPEGKKASAFYTRVRKKISQNKK